MRILRLALLTAIAALLLTAAPGFAAATRYAAPIAVGTGDCSSTANACSLADAITGVGAADHDDISLASGTYPSINNIQVLHTDMTIHGAPGATTLITGNGTNPTFLSYYETHYRDLQLDVSDTGVDPAIRADSVTGVTLDRVSIKNSGVGSGSALRMGADTVVRDSVLNANPTTSLHSVVFGGGAIYNSTIVASPTGGNSAYGIDRTCNLGGGPSLDVANSIVIGAGGSGAAIHIDSVSGGPCSLPTPVTNSYLEGGTIDNGSNLNPTANVPGPIALDSGFKELPGSSTIDRGTSSVLVPGELSLFGSARCLGSAPDVGADEFSGAPCPPPTSAGGGGGGGDVTAPAVSGLKAKKKKGKLKTFDFTANEAGTATFTFTVKKGKKYKKAGSQTKAVKAGKNSIKPKKLKKGKYKLVLTVKDAAGNVSSSKKLSFSTK